MSDVATGSVPSFVAVRVGLLGDCCVNGAVAVHPVTWKVPKLGHVPSDTHQWHVFLRGTHEINHLLGDRDTFISLMLFLGVSKHTSSYSRQGSCEQSLLLWEGPQSAIRFVNLGNLLVMAA